MMQEIQMRCTIQEQLSEEEQQIFKRYDQQRHELSRQQFLYQTAGVLTAFYSIMGGCGITSVYSRYPSDHHDDLVVFFFATVAIIFGYEAYKTGKEGLASWKKAKQLKQEVAKLKGQLNPETHSDLEKLVY